MPNSTGVYENTPGGFEMWCFDQLPPGVRAQLRTTQRRLSKVALSVQSGKSVAELQSEFCRQFKE